MGVLDGVSMGIGSETVETAVTFVEGAVLGLGLEKEFLHFAKRMAFDGLAGLRDNLRNFRNPTAGKPGEKAEILFLRELLSLSGNGRFKMSDAVVKLVEADSLEGLRLSHRLHLLLIEARRKDQLVAVHPLRKVLLHFFRRGQEFTPALIFGNETFPQIRHLVFVPGNFGLRHAATDVFAFQGARAEGDMHMEIVRVVMNAVGVANRVVAVKAVSEFPHDFFRGGVQNAVGADTRFHQPVVQLA